MPNSFITGWSIERVLMFYSFWLRQHCQLLHCKLILNTHLYSCSQIFHSLWSIQPGIALSVVAVITELSLLSRNVSEMCLFWVQNITNTFNRYINQNCPKLYKLKNSYLWPAVRVRFSMWTNTCKMLWTCSLLFIYN